MTIALLGFASFKSQDRASWYLGGVALCISFVMILLWGSKFAPKPLFCSPDHRKEDEDDAEPAFHSKEDTDEKAAKEMESECKDNNLACRGSPYSSNSSSTSNASCTRPFQDSSFGDGQRTADVTHFVDKGVGLNETLDHGELRMHS